MITLADTKINAIEPIASCTLQLSRSQSKSFLVFRPFPFYYWNGLDPSSGRLYRWRHSWWLISPFTFGRTVHFRKTSTFYGKNRYECLRICHLYVQSFAKDWRILIVLKTWKMRQCLTCQSLAKDCRISINQLVWIRPMMTLLDFLSLKLVRLGNSKSWN